MLTLIWYLINISKLRAILNKFIEESKEMPRHQAIKKYSDEIFPQVREFQKTMNLWFLLDISIGIFLLSLGEYLRSQV